MRKYALIFFVIALICYLFGAIFAFLGWVIDWSVYLIMVAIVGGLASVFGLLGMVSSPLADADIRNLRSDSLKQLAQTAEEIERKQERLEEANQQINSLELKKEELEVLVERASLSLYYKNELERSYNKLHTLIRSEDHINNLILEIQQLEYDAKSLDSEIEINNDIKDIIATIQKAKEKSERKPSFMEVLLGVMKVEVTL